MSRPLQFFYLNLMSENRPSGPKKSQKGHTIRQNRNVKLQWNLEIRIWLEYLSIWVHTNTVFSPHPNTKTSQNGPPKKLKMVLKLSKNYKLYQKKSSKLKFLVYMSMYQNKYFRPSPYPKLGPVVPEKAQKWDEN